MVFLVQFFWLRREKARSEQRLDQMEQDTRIKVAWFVVRNAERQGEEPPADMLEEAKQPTSEERGASREDRGPVAGNWPWVRASRKAQDEQQAWDDLRSMAEIYCAIPDEQSLRLARVLVRTELDHRIADWNAKTRAAYGTRSAVAR